MDQGNSAHIRLYNKHGLERDIKTDYWCKGILRPTVREITGIPSPKNMALTYFSYNSNHCLIWNSDGSQLSLLSLDVHYQPLMNYLAWVMTTRANVTQVCTLCTTLCLLLGLTRSVPTHSRLFREAERLWLWGSLCSQAVSEIPQTVAGPDRYAVVGPSTRFKERRGEAHYAATGLCVCIYIYIYIYVCVCVCMYVCRVRHLCGPLCVCSHTGMCSSLFEYMSGC